MSPPLSKDAAPLDTETLATLRAEIDKRGMSADRLRKRLVPSVSGATFWRALRGQKVSKPVQDACDAMARSIREQGHSRPVVLSLEHGVVQPVDSTVFTLADADAAVAHIQLQREVTYDFDPDPEAPPPPIEPGRNVVLTGILRNEGELP